MRRLRESIYLQIATNIINLGFECTDVPMVQEIHRDMRSSHPQHPRGSIGMLARDYLEQAEKLPGAFVEDQE